jgi:sugar O-acyltransferase (sialic acid O-acetyltransferase NeuD family)
MKYKLAIIGTGDFAREVADLAIVCGQEDICFVCEDINDITFGEGHYRDIPIAYPEDRMPCMDYVLGMGNPTVREKVNKNLIERFGNSWTKLIHPSTIMGYSDSIWIAHGALICAGCILTNRIDIGKHAIINLGCTIGHDCVIGDYAELSPGCHINGHTTIGKGASLGSGVVTVPHAKIGDNCIIGAGAVVKGELTEPGVYVGIPAKKIK